jgi:hypothetical protein
MTILADHAGDEHPALKERSIFIYFIFYLTIRVIQSLFQQGRPMGFQEAFSVNIIFCHYRPPGMTPGTHVNEGSYLTWHRTFCCPGLHIKHPCGLVGIFKPYNQSEVRIDIRTSSPVNMLCPFDML